MKISEKFKFALPSRDEEDIVDINVISDNFVKIDENVPTREEIIGEKTEYGGEIFNNYKNNFAFSLYSSASGSGTIAGIHAFKINSVSPDRKCYYLDSCEGLDKDDVFSAILGNNTYLDAGTIDVVDKKNNSVTVKYNGTTDILSERTIWSNTMRGSFNMSAALAGTGASNDRVVLVLGNVTVNNPNWNSSKVGNWQIHFERNGGINFQVHDGYSAENDFWWGATYQLFNYPSGTKNYEGPYSVKYTLTDSNIKIWMNDICVVDYDYAAWRDYTVTLNSFASGFIGAGNATLANVTDHIVSQDNYEFYFAVAAKPTIGTVDFGKYAKASGYLTQASGYAGVTEGVRTKALHSGTYAGGLESVSGASLAFTHGQKCIVDAYAGVALCFETIVKGIRGMAVNSGTQSIGDSSFASNLNTKALGTGSFTTGGGTEAEADYSYSGGYGTKATAIAQTVVGKFNKPNPDAAFIVGNGTSADSPSNALEVLWDGSLVVGGVTITPEQLQKLLMLI